MKYPAIETLLSRVEKPSRYIGGEINSIKKDWARCKLSFALAFPDTYEVGMSHLGIQILYSILNSESRIAAERFFAPWPDMEQRMRALGIPLASHESRIPLNQFDVVGFSLQYELSYTNVLNMLELGNIPLFANDRDEGSPVVVAGGPCVFNPEPVRPFFDAFVIGEGEDVIREISNAVMEGKEKGYNRRAILSSLASVDGIYVPSVHVNGETIRKRIVTDINRYVLPCHPIVPLTKIIHDRVTLEIARGCSRGCRFCQAGMVWRPTRERTPHNLMKMADQMLSSTGYDEISLLSLSSGDYSCIEYLLTSLMNRYYDKRIAMALPSMRVETLTDRLIEEIKRVRKTSFTLAPEAGTQRLRNIINKGNTEENLLNTTRRVFDAGWRSVKLYFMLGLPTEQDHDLEGIVDLGYKVLKEGAKKKQVTISVSTFVPKPHTPFQWTRQIGLDEILDKQEFLKNTIRHRNLKFKWHDGRMSLLEGILSRGDERVSELIVKAFRLGCRFDGWGELFRFDLWQRALSESAIAPDEYIQERTIRGHLPWDRIDTGVSRAFLADEYEKSLREELTEDCRLGKCHKCGVCDKEYKITLARDTVPLAPEGTGKDTNHADPGESPRKLRIRFTKKNEARHLSHLELSSAIIRGIKRSGLTFVFTDGFHPHPKASFSFATPVGIESDCEYVDIQIKNLPDDVGDLKTVIGASLPSDVEIHDIEEISLQAEALTKIIVGFDYELHLPEGIETADFDSVEKKAGDFMAGGSFIVTRSKKGKTIKKNIRPFVNNLTVDRKDRVIIISSRFGSDGGINPREVMKNVFRLNDEIIEKTRIIKARPKFSDRTEYHAKRDDI